MKKVFMLLMAMLFMALAIPEGMAQEITITMYPGWTWISYTKAETMDIVTALGDFVPMEGDIIESQYSYSVYQNGQWRGHLQQFTPGLGYMYYSMRSEPVSFVFSSESAGVSVPTGAINGKFTINQNGDQVFFSQGNLQYQASTATWRFAESQHDIIGNGNNNISPTYHGWIDLFGWGTSGYNHGAVCYQPYSVSTGYNDYNAYGDGLNSLYVQTGQADWGYNAIINGGNQENMGWRTLTSGEWYYIYQNRTTPSGMRYAKAKVNGVNGLILLPDDWNENYYPLNEVNLYYGGLNFNSNVITLQNWFFFFHPHGAVFLPAAGSGSGDNAGEEGLYWSSTCQTYGMAYDFEFMNYIVFGHYSERYNRHSVRLVINVE